MTRTFAVLSILGALALSACGSSTSDRAISGAGIGAGAGAALGAVTGGSVVGGALIGGAAGAGGRRPDQGRRYQSRQARVALEEDDPARMSAPGLTVRDEDAAVLGG